MKNSGTFFAHFTASCSGLSVCLSVRLSFGRSSFPKWNSLKNIWPFLLFNGLFKAFSPNFFFFYLLLVYFDMFFFFILLTFRDWIHRNRASQTILTTKCQKKGKKFWRTSWDFFMLMVVLVKQSSSM